MRRPYIFCLLAIVATGCAPASEAAEYAVPGSDMKVAIERKPAHRVFAEYHRTAYLLVGDQTVAQLALLLDSGGYSRTNLYQIDQARLLMRDAEGSYTIDLGSYEITKDEMRRRVGTFQGSFDVDSSGVWRFVPANERPELPTEYEGG